MKLPFMDTFRHNEEISLPADKERIQHALDIERTLHELEPHIHDRNDFDKVIPLVLKTAREFYQADWAGFVDVDLELKLWTPYVWDNPDPADRTTDLIQEAQSGEFLPEWLDALDRNQTIIRYNLDQLGAGQKSAATLYKHLSFKNVIAVPVSPQPNGFFLVRNPARYQNFSSMLSVLSFVLMSAINEKKQRKSLQLAIAPEHIEDSREVVIKLFGDLEICTSQGIMKESDIKSPRICRLLTYMLLNKSNNYAPAKIAEALWPDELDLDNTRKNLRNLIYRFRQSYNLVSPYRLIESTSRGYCLNPNLIIQTDLQIFDRYYSLAQQSTDISVQIEYLIKAFELYRGEVLEQASGEHWLIPVANRYAALYETVVNMLLEKLSKKFALHCILHYALESLRFIPDNWKAHYWLIFAACHSGAVELAKKQLHTARTKLIDEDYLELLNAVRTNAIPLKDSLFS